MPFRTRARQKASRRQKPQTRRRGIGSVMNDGSAAIRMAGLRHFACTEPAVLGLKNGRTITSPKTRLGCHTIDAMAQDRHICLNTGRFCGRRISDAVQRCCENYETEQPDKPIDSSGAWQRHPGLSYRSGPSTKAPGRTVRPGRAIIQRTSY